VLQQTINVIALLYIHLISEVIGQMQAEIKTVRLHMGTHQTLMALAGAMQAEKGDRVSANEAISMLLSEHLAYSEYTAEDTIQSRS